MGDWKTVLMEQRAKQLMCWFEPFVQTAGPENVLSAPRPLERADENSNTYWDWLMSHA
jgi:arylsulfatase